jgi:hypothetical protein
MNFAHRDEAFLEMEQLTSDAITRLLSATPTDAAAPGAAVGGEGHPTTAATAAAPAKPGTADRPPVAAGAAAPPKKVGGLHPSRPLSRRV